MACVLEDLDHPFDVVVRTKPASFAHKTLTYDHLMGHPSLLLRYGLIVHATPLGTFPQTHTRITFPFEALQSSHLLYDLVYQPPQTALMKAFAQQKCKTFNGKSMLVAQAQKSWDIWMKSRPIHRIRASCCIFVKTKTKIIPKRTRSLTGRASDYGSEGWGFESLRVHKDFLPLPPLRRSLPLGPCF